MNGDTVRTILVSVIITNLMFTVKCSVSTLEQTEAKGAEFDTLDQPVSCNGGLVRLSALCGDNLEEGDDRRPDHDDEYS